MRCNQEQRLDFNFLKQLELPEEATYIFERAVQTLNALVKWFLTNSSFSLLYSLPPPQIILSVVRFFHFPRKPIIFHSFF